MKHYVKPQPQVTKEVDKFVANKFVLENFLFDEQLKFVEDPAPFKAAVCSRRAGKTISCAAHLIHTCLNNPDTTCLYITLSRSNAKRIIWKDLVKINKDYKLNGVTNDTELTISYPNGSILYLSGANDQSEIEKFRGMAIKLCYIDECQSFKEYIKDLIDDVIAPALMDYAGSLCLIGTPAPIPSGYFHECAVKSDVWSKHAWTFWNNPHIAVKSKKTHQQILDRELKRRGVTVQDPSIQREWFGKWVLDLNSLLLQYNETVNDFTDLMPHTKYHYILGVDIGFKDADALCVLAHSDFDQSTYLVEELIKPKQDITDLAEQIKHLMKKYDCYKVIGDMGALGKKIGEELIRRHHIPIEAADKTRKIENIAFLNDALRRGHFKAHKNSRFVQDTYLVEIDRDKSTPESIKISTRFHSDIVDAVLYAFKLSPAYTWEPPSKKPKYGSKEWAEMQAGSMFEAELAGMQEEADKLKIYGDYS